MSILEGGPFKCYNHLDKDGEPFTTESHDEWNAHCTDTPHFDSVTANCAKCGELTQQLVPFLKFQSNGAKESISKIHCDNCSEELEVAKKEYKARTKK